LKSEDIFALYRMSTKLQIGIYRAVLTNAVILSERSESKDLSAEITLLPNENG